jgi:hypothetical protein
MLDEGQNTIHCEVMKQNFVGQIFTEEIDTGQAEVDLEFTRSGISAMTTRGQFFEIPFSQCTLKAGGVNRRLLFCSHCDRTLTICCEDAEFSLALRESSCGLLDAQLERQLKYSSSKPTKYNFLGLNLFMAIMMIVLGVYLITQA